MSNKEFIDKYPCSFTAFLETVKDEERLECGETRYFPEGMIGEYLKWFLDKKGFDLEIQNLKKELQKEREVVDYYAKEIHWMFLEMSYAEIEEDYEKLGKERQIITGGKRARQRQRGRVDL